MRAAMIGCRVCMYATRQLLRGTLLTPRSLHRLPCFACVRSMRHAQDRLDVVPLDKSCAARLMSASG